MIPNIFTGNQVNLDMASENVNHRSPVYETDVYQPVMDEMQTKSYLKDNFVISPLNLRSSVLCPENRRLTSQYLALEQLHAHQKMVTNAKGYVDTSAPRSMGSYLSCIEKRRKGSKSCGRMSSPGIEKSSKHKMFHNVADQQGSSDTGDQGEEISVFPSTGSLDKGIQTVLPLSSSKVADKISWYLEAVGQGEFNTTTFTNSFMEGCVDLSGSKSSVASSFGLERGNKGDVMDWHPNAFTQAKRPFSPRILVKNCARSKVCDMRCYNAPKKKILGTATAVNVVPNKYENSNFVSPIKSNVDYNDWISDQAQRVLMRQRMKSKVTNNNSGFHAVAQESYPEMPVERHSNCQSPLGMLSCDEESKYLNYLSEVTEDILRSGIYTDRAIKRAFEFHLQFHEKEADRVKLIQLLEQVLEDLHIDDCEDSFQRGGLLTSVKSTSLCNSPPEKETLEQLLINSLTPKAGVSNTPTDLAIENADHFNFISAELNVLQDVPCVDSTDKERLKLSSQIRSNNSHPPNDNSVS